MVFTHSHLLKHVVLADTLEDLHQQLHQFQYLNLIRPTISISSNKYVDVSLQREVTANSYNKDVVLFVMILVESL